jgi:hypothetical protein
MVRSRGRRGPRPKRQVSDFEADLPKLGLELELELDTHRESCIPLPPLRNLGGLAPDARRELRQIFLGRKDVVHQLEEVSSVVVPRVNGVDVDAGDGDVRYFNRLIVGLSMVVKFFWRRRGSDWLADDASTAVSNGIQDERVGFSKMNMDIWLLEMDI